MRKLIGYVLTPVFYLVFGLLLVIFHGLQWLCLKIGGYSAHKWSVDMLNLFLTGSYYLLGNTVKWTNKQQLPIGKPIIFVANHQSMFDIPPLIYFLRKHHAKFISKIELTKGIPSISFNLKHGGGANIDRKDSKQAVAEILNLANNMKKYGWSTVIFPEGTRARTGVMKPFQVGGIATILKKAPDALIVPIAINHSWRMQRYGMFPSDTFVQMTWEILPPIQPNGRPVEELVLEAEQAIRSALSLHK